MQEAEGLRLHLSRCGRSAIGATGYTGVTRSASGRLYEARSQENGNPVKLGSFSRAVDAAVAYARYRLQRGKEGFESEPEADGEDGEEPQASAKAERPVEPVALHAESRRLSPLTGSPPRGSPASQGLLAAKGAPHRATQETAPGGAWQELALALGPGPRRTPPRELDGELKSVKKKK